MIQDVGYYRRSSVGNHGDTLGRNNDIGLKCEVRLLNYIRWKLLRFFVS